MIWFILYLFYNDSVYCWPSLLLICYGVMYFLNIRVLLSSSEAYLGPFHIHMMKTVNNFYPLNIIAKGLPYRCLSDKV